MAVKKRTRTRKVLKIVLILLVVIVAVRLALPYVILHYTNKTLANMPGYRGHIYDIDLALLRGAYKIDSIYLHKVDTVSLKETPFFEASAIDLSVEWKALLHGELVGELAFRKPMLRFTKDKVEPDDVKKDSTDFKKLLDDFMPLRVNRFEIVDGSIRYIDETAKPKVDIAMTNAQVLALNLINSYDSTTLLPATITGKAEVYDGTVSLKMKLNPLAEVPTFDMNAELKNTNLVKLNDFFKAYAKADVNKGTFGLYTEIAAKEGKFTGYVKPLVRDLEVLGHEDRKDNIFQKLWEAIVDTAGELFENQSRNTVATKVPFKGDVQDPEANVWYAMVHVLQNAFIRAIQPSLDQEISIASVDAGKKEKKNFVEKIFSKDDDKKKDKKEDKEDKKDRKKKDSKDKG